MRFASFCLGLAALVCLTVVPVWAADPTLTIVFAGNTYGYFDPCPTCGPEKLGGLARRASYIRQARQDAATAGKVLAVAGAWEFAPEVSAAPPQPAKLPAVATAQSRMGYDVAVITPDELKVLAANKATPPAGFTVLGEEPQTKILSVAGKSVGLVFFPMPRDISAPVPEKLMDATARAAAALRGKVALVVGVSPWGALDEEAFINSRPGAVDVLLGSGGGSGFPARTSKDGKTLWTRAYIKGKTVNRLDLFALPGARDFTWKTEGAYTAKVTPLDTAYPQDQALEALF